MTREETPPFDIEIGDHKHYEADENGKIELKYAISAEGLEAYYRDRARKGQK